MNGKIVVAGAGSIGCFVGGLLASGGERVTLLARERIAAEVAANGLTLGSFEGWREQISSDALTLETDPARAFADAALVLVTVKSGATGEMARLIDAHAPAGTPVISLQNGLDNADRLRAVLTDRPVFAGMVSFNVLHQGNGSFHRGTSGPLVVESGAPLLRLPHVEVVQGTDMTAVLAGKLVYNLNNALNALSGLTLREQLGNREWRRLLADCQDEALKTFAATGVVPWSLGGLPVRRFPAVLRLPDPLFRLVARRGVKIDAAARSSMWEDLQRGRPTEIDELQGKVVALARRLGIAAPVNRAVLEAVREAEGGGPDSPRMTPAQLRIRVRS